jgi:hypothetical protein
MVYTKKHKKIFFILKLKYLVLKILIFNHFKFKGNKITVKTVRKLDGTETSE